MNTEEEIIDSVGFSIWSSVLNRVGESASLTVRRSVREFVLISVNLPIVNTVNNSVEDYEYL